MSYEIEILLGAFCGITAGLLVLILLSVEGWNRMKYRKQCEMYVQLKLLNQKLDDFKKMKVYSISA